MASPRMMNHSNMGLENLESRVFLAAVGPVSDDRFEPNDAVKQVTKAAPGASGSANFGAMEGEKVLANVKLFDARDIFRFELTAPGEGNDLARIKLDNRKGNLDLRLMNSNGQVVRESVSKKNNEVVSLSGLPAGEYFIQVVGRAGAKNANYRLVVNIAPKETPPDDDGGDQGGDDGGSSGGGGGGVQTPEDAYETSNDSIEQVRLLSPGAPNSANFGLINSSFSLMNLKLSDSHDIYRFELSENRPSHACVRIASMEPMNLILFNSEGQSIALADAYNGVDTIMLNNLAAGEYFVHVSHYALENPTDMDYGLQFNFSGD